ncbi:unnamed protein product [Cercopithifilaria johnstoni]|uniref:Tetratricopeptide repeat protein n=1 Tax=Cercopithifilaria johnstoni TaxID=2874296 RepID=A0A8J2PSX6_9BILA|nr:unnamed protein product [Cercopithifilaria johnstoni]
MKSEDKRENAELEYRLAHACYILSNFCLSKENERYHLLEEAYLSCKSAYIPESKNAEILKWSAIITGTLAELNDLSDFERMTYVREFKKFLDEALTGPPDSSVYHMHGRFCYRMATLSEKEKEFIIAAFDSLPICTIDEALNNFHKAEKLTSGHIDNLIHLGKCYIAKGNYSEAQKYLEPILKITPTDEIDQALIAEAHELLADIEESDIQNENQKNEENENLDEVNTDETEISTATNGHSEEEPDVID